MDRNIGDLKGAIENIGVALRKESVDRNVGADGCGNVLGVALRKESVDRNLFLRVIPCILKSVALRKESVDRNTF